MKVINNANNGLVVTNPKRYRIYQPKIIKEKVS